MAVSITDANVIGIVGRNVTAGATITAGQVVYLDTADNDDAKLADAGAEGTAVCAGIALNGAADGQPLALHTGGTITIGGTVVVGTVYCVSDTTAGGIEAIGDLAAADYVTIIGYADTTSTIVVDIKVSGVQVPA